MRTHFIRGSFVLIAMAFSSIAYAHPGHGDSYLAGMAHPFMGLDHLLAMLAVGIWAFQLGGRAKWLVPASFVALMAVAGGLGMTGIKLPMVESSIATSVLLLGLLIAFAVKMPPALGAAIVAVFAVFHGYAHGTEMPLLATPLQYGIGFVLSTAALLCTGLLLGQGLHKQAVWLRAAGALIAAGGVWMMAMS